MGATERIEPSSKHAEQPARLPGTSAPSSAATLTMRALAAILLSVAFYALALCMAGVLIYIPVFEARSSGGRQEPSLLILWLAAGAILWSILPRPERFEAPGAKLRAEEQPELFAVIDRVARAAGQPRPPEVYLIRDFNAWVSSRGGLLGFGSRRTMAIGLPLLVVLTVAQLEGVLAHEFGHYAGGDVKLGPLIYRTRAAIGRVVRTLAGSGHMLLHIIHRPFVWYGAFFLRFTQAISRHQELAADALAARMVGPQCFTGALKAVHAGGIAFELYWRGLVAPVLASGFRPPLASGFAEFRSSAMLADKFEAFVGEAAKPGAQADPYDSHPPLPERIACIEALSEIPPVLPADLRPASQLLRDPEASEALLLEAIAPSPEAFRALQRIDLATAWARMSLEAWKLRTAQAATALGNMTASTVPTDVTGLAALAHRLPRLRATGATPEELAEQTANVIAAATACTLVAAGWRLEVSPGGPAVLRKGQSEVRPGSVLRGLARGTAQPNDWHSLHTNAGISHVPLAAAAGRIPTG
jgi:Zn-dependent protease with chaperone function